MLHLELPLQDSSFIKNYSHNSYVKLGYAIVLLLVLFFGGWATFAPLESAIVAPATVTVEGFRKKIQHLDGGIINKLLITEGEFVKKNQHLISLDKTQLQVQMQLVETELLTSLAKKARLIADRENVSKPDFSQLPSTSSTNEIKASQMAIFIATSKAREGEQLILNSKIQQLKVSNQGLKALIGTKENRINSYQSEFKDLSALALKGYTSKQQLRQIERIIEEIKGEIAEHRSQIANIDIQIGEVKLNILQLKRQYLLDTNSQLDEIQKVILDKQERRQALLDKLNRSEIYAPVSGKVLAMSVHTLGGIVKPGDTILQIVPNEDTLVLDAKVSPLEISRLSLGQHVDLRFSTFKNADTLIIDGTVENISADRLENERAEQQYYLVRISVKPESQHLLTKNGLKLLPGMPAEVHIKTGTQTLMAYLLQPMKKMFARSMVEQ